MKGTHLFRAFLLMAFVFIAAWAGFAPANTSSKLSFEKTVCDLGRVGLSTKNTCEFRFTNTGREPLKITNVKRTLSVS